jgi:hypothetical protein
MMWQNFPVLLSNNCATSSYQPKISGTGGGGENKSPNIEDVDYRDEL